MLLGQIFLFLTNALQKAVTPEEAASQLLKSLIAYSLDFCHTSHINAHLTRFFYLYFSESIGISAKRYQAETDVA